MPFNAMMLRSSSGSGPTGLYGLILSLSPTFYFRHAESSGIVMANQVGTNGDYTPGTPLNQAAIYTGGPTSFLADTTGHYGSSNSGTFPASTSISLMTIVKFNSLSGTRSIISRDQGGAGRSFQWRMNGSVMEWVKIVGGVTVTTSSSSPVVSTAAHVGVTVSTGGAVKLYKNGIEVGSATIAAANYGGTADVLQIGFFSGASAANSYFSESAIWCGTELSAANMLACATAAGF